MGINKKKGFTLIELMVVIAIIGILASIVLVSLNSARKKSRDARRLSDIKQLQLALEMYFDSNGHYPTALSDLVTGGYMSQVPTDPLTGDNYSYAYYPSTDPTDYHLGATIEDPSGVKALDSDQDCNSAGTTCPAGAAYTNGFDGADPVFDVVP